MDSEGHFLDWYIWLFRLLSFLALLFEGLFKLAASISSYNMSESD